MTTMQYVYRITQVVKVTDGDTYWLRVDVGFRQEILINVRLHGYDCPEAHRGTAYEKQKAVEAQVVAREFFKTSDDERPWIRTEKDPDNFGRWLGDIWWELEHGAYHLGAWLREKGLATVWPTRWRDEYDTERATDP